MNKPDPILYDLPMLIAKNKTNLWQEHSTKTSTALMRFLKKHDLLIGVEPFDEQGKLKTNTIIKKSNLTPDGLELFKTVVNSWLKYLDRSSATNKYQNFNRLENGLTEIRDFIKARDEKDYTLHNLPMLLTRNKNKWWLDSVMQSSTALLSFLKKHELLIGVEPFDEQGNLKTNTVIKKSNLTPDGLELYKTAVDGWYNYLDRSTVADKYQNVSRLEKGLAKIRENKNKEVDFIVYDVAVSLATNKINQLPEPIIQSSIALLVFLKQHQLLIGVELFDKKGNLKTDTVIKKSNLTPDGLELFKTAVDDWLASVDKTTAANKYQNVSRLEQALAQIRESD
ncbi:MULTISPECIES: hypothetical protein [unclassified Gilliamella]|uniref:hypothetical protein n=1 Tax=unclassified Gilliamella TaxID=2685620 RepID=UPI00226A07E9|nr:MULTISPECIES: hypothetical protein [unclassified Gilliamella]MCX8642513.1 hypothetical protein [Gilliamella sp. B3835]MCX8706363.1 hypothetical protein [Gilliamella sp. B3783]MCX8709737.1 hypothetical protein [Gilliamella sp. B3780]MCX8714414.1 hypothetical protein [Gilliamella sp. B3781]MCX8717095.1 hypothetical protein [Gilliamella sp. B3784]